MDKLYVLIIGTGLVGAILGVFAPMLGAELLGFAAIFLGVLAVLSGIVGSLWNAQ